MGKLAWGVLGTGMIAKHFAKALAVSETGTLLAVGSRTVEGANKFGDEFKVPKRYGNYADVIADKDVQAVYISLPNSDHAEWAIRCAQAGKQILCEKPLTSNHPEAMAVIESARHHKVFLMEAFMYRCHPQTAKIVELVKSGAIGEVRFIHSTFSYHHGSQPGNIRAQASLSGGGIMDVGCYPISFARLVAGAARGLTGPAEPLEVKGSAHLESSYEGAVDTWAAATLKFPGDIVASVHCGMQVDIPAPTVIYGTKGRLVVRNPWFPGDAPGTAVLELHTSGEKEPQIIDVPSKSGLYTVEADVVAANLAIKQAPSPSMTWADSLGNMQALDAWRASIGLKFPCEKAETGLKTVSRQPLKVRPGCDMPTGSIPGVNKPVSRLAMGTMGHVLGHENLSKAFAMLDHFVEMGGNTLDTAHYYGERDTGAWLAARKIREQMVIISKGAASPCNIETMNSQFKNSLELLKTDYVDIYLLHRDNPEIPVGEFVDALNEHVRAGRMRAFGGSNWTIERLHAANEYAKKKGVPGFTCSSPNFTLASWNEPMWAGCISSRDAASREFYQKSNVALFAWSSQASGFFSGKFKQEDAGNPAIKDIVRTWYNDANFERLKRVQELARKKGVTGPEIALAYVLCQPMNMFALIGPNNFDEMQSSFDALNVRLTAQELAWLDLQG